MPSSTTILGPWIEKAYFTEEARDRGTAVHQAAACHLMGLWAPSLPPGWQPYFDSFRRWADVSIEKIILVEERMRSHKYGYNGKPDLIALLRGDEDLGNTLADWKTGVGSAWWWPLQVASYRQLAFETGMVTYRGISVRLKSDGSMPKIYDYKHRPFQADLNVFLGGLVMYNFRKNS
ncbi:MAG: hypothetical protein DRH97_02940 [Chloroflexi bacterium]|nr:MAG: hypothetical protein DRH97_02940 [Chloroflexota bacterium]